jgi:hypothetical protein
MTFALIRHHFIFLPSVRFPACLFPMTLKAFRGEQFGFLPELFAVNSRRFYRDLSTGRESIALYAPRRSVVVAFIRLVNGRHCACISSLGTDDFQEYDLNAA